MRKIDATWEAAKVWQSQISSSWVKGEEDYGCRKNAESLSKEIDRYRESIQHLQSLLEDTPEIQLFNEEERKYFSVLWI